MAGVYFTLNDFNQRPEGNALFYDRLQTFKRAVGKEDGGIRKNITQKKVHKQHIHTHTYTRTHTHTKSSQEKGEESSRFPPISSHH